MCVCVCPAAFPSLVPYCGLVCLDGDHPLIDTCLPCLPQDNPGNKNHEWSTHCSTVTIRKTRAQTMSVCLPRAWKETGRGEERIKTKRTWRHESLSDKSGRTALCAADAVGPSGWHVSVISKIVRVILAEERMPVCSGTGGLDAFQSLVTAVQRSAPVSTDTQKGEETGPDTRTSWLGDNDPSGWC